LGGGGGGGAEWLGWGGAHDSTPHNSTQGWAMQRPAVPRLLGPAQFGLSLTEKVKKSVCRIHLWVGVLNDTSLDYSRHTSSIISTMITLLFYCNASVTLKSYRYFKCNEHLLQR
jgi:hypothetical protein